jgi:hypothetical protein
MIALHCLHALYPGCIDDVVMIQWLLALYYFYVLDSPSSAFMADIQKGMFTLHAGNFHLLTTVLLRHHKEYALLLRRIVGVCDIMLILCRCCQYKIVGPGALRASIACGFQSFIRSKTVYW